tara:strand:+ start:4023 stop:4223 length:201 start_codon:yes stop_codon:yes gene_type:complete
VNDKEYNLKTVERGTNMILAKSIEDDPVRYMYIYEISAEWLRSHFPNLNPRDDVIIQEWLDESFRQ